MAWVRGTGRLYCCRVDRKEFRRRLAQRPNAVRFPEIERLLGLYGFELDTVRGSHHVFRDGDGRHVSVPRRVPFVKRAYVREVLHLTEGYDDDD
jgi:predicted RNA binding protein YcfA (HicA-like mRNA interferase family)